MKILFTGPTLYGAVRDGRIAEAPEILCRPPARQGDVFAAVEAGATVIGLVDGRYDDVAAPWHKEILYALEQGCRMFGAGSLGALRAAECAAFGMVGIGRIFQRYLAGELVDDSDVAQIHGPEELDHLPLSEPRVNIEATLDALLADGRLAAELHARLMDAALRIFFAELSWPRIADAAGLDPDGRAALLALLTEARIDRKRLDALELVAEMHRLPDRRSETPAAWRMAQPHRWRMFVAGARAARGTPEG